METVTYAASQEVFCNPERGIFTHQEFHSADRHALTPEFLRGLRSQGISLVFCGFVMEDYRTCLIPDSYLERVRTTLALLRAEGLKAVVRFSYSFSENDRPWDVPWSLTRQHIAQLRPLLQDNADVIAVLEAGFVGVWGEWYYTENYVFEPRSAADYAPRREVLDALLEALPSSRCVVVRYPDAKLRTLGIGYADTLTAATAFDGSPRSRIGFHNDGFLATSDDYGTFQNKSDARRYWMQETRFLPMGGETAKLSSYCSVDNASKQFANYHWSYLNRDYHPDVIGKWRDEGLYPTIERRLGYRLLLSEAQFTASPKAGEPYSVNLTLRNVGWASPFNAHTVELVWQNVRYPRCCYVLPVSRDVRTWEAGSRPFLSLRMVLPASMPEGDYRIALRIADPMPTLAARPAYAIRLANEDVWDEATGTNILRVVHVSAATGAESPYGARLQVAAPVKSLWAGSQRSVTLSSKAFSEAQVGDTLQFVVAREGCQVVTMPIDGALLTTLLSRGITWSPEGDGWVQAVNLIEPDHQHPAGVQALTRGDTDSVSGYDLQGRPSTAPALLSGAPALRIVDGRKYLVR